VKRPDLAALALVALGLIAITVLTLARVGIPDVLTYVIVGALGVGGGVALPGGSSSTPEPAPAPAATPAAPEPLTSEPATGVMRLATHAP
jgi:hypothetical protein